MAVEVLHPDQPWRIDLPAEPPRDRVLEARNKDGSVAWTWVYTPERYGWVRKGMFGEYLTGWPGVVEACIGRWQLWSLPAERQEQTDG